MRWRALGAVCSVAILGIGCGGGSPSDPGPVSIDVATPTSGFDKPAGGWSLPAAFHTPNSPPNLIVRTRPAAQPGSPYPVVFGRAPLTVKFNLCRSDDPDQEPDGQPTSGEGDSLNWQFHFGDDGSEAINPDGTFNANVGQMCRTEHTYAEGTYVATVSVTDKHLEDQSRDLSSAARIIERLTIDVGAGAPAGAPAGSSQTLDFTIPAGMAPPWVSDIYSFTAAPGTLLDVTVDTVSAATSFDPFFSLGSDAQVALLSDPNLFAFQDDDFPCTFPPPMFDCPTGVTVLPADADGVYYLAVGMGSANFAGSTGRYSLTVTPSAPIGPLTLVQNNASLPF